MHLPYCDGGSPYIRWGKHLVLASRERTLRPVTTRVRSAADPTQSKSFEH